MATDGILDVLYVEDSKADIIIFERALKKTRSNINLHIVYDGEEALDFLYKRNEFEENSVVPDIIFLDLNLPKINGFEVLDTIKKDEDLRIIPVIVLTTSKAEEDVKNAYNRHTNAYIRKPVRSYEFGKIMEAAKHFWFVVNEYPGGN